VGNKRDKSAGIGIEKYRRKQPDEKNKTRIGKFGIRKT
jgi:hypothetical protein